MAGLPGLSLPGLSSSTPVPRSNSTNVAAAAAVLAPPRTETLAARSELRFEVAFDALYKIKLVRGSAEIFGTELAPNASYTLSGTKGAVFTWEGCTLEVQGEAESEYTGSETEAMVEWVNLHGMLETLRSSPDGSGNADGPRLLLLGPDSTGKTSLAQCLTAWAIKSGHAPTVLHLDPRDSVLGCPPSSLVAATYASQLDVEALSTWGQSGISGPTNLAPRSPLVHHYPFADPTGHADLYKALATRLALDATSKLESDPSLRRAGFLLDAPAALARPGEGYALASHLISEFSVTIVVTLGSERLYNDTVRRIVSAAAPGETVHVLRVSPSSGAVSRDEGWRKTQRASHIRSYFFGEPRLGLALNPHSVSVPFAELTVYIARDPREGSGGLAAADFMPGGGGDDDDDDYDPSGAAGDGSGTAGRGAAAGNGGFEKVEPGQRLLNSILAIKYVSGGAGWEAIRDAAVMGFVYVAEVDDARKRIRFLTPHPGRWGDRVLVGGPWPEGVGDLVA